MKIGIIFGSKSQEHDVSVVSASYVLKNLNKKKYDVYPIYIDKSNDWYEVLDNIKIYKIGEVPSNIKAINNVFKYLKNLDCVFPVMHGTYGEDGAIQGLLKMLDIPCVGPDILASSICMDKVYTKIVLKNSGINVTPSLYIKHENNDFFYIDEAFNVKCVTVLDIDKLIREKFGYPVYVKPANSGSSVGINNASNQDELNVALYEARKHDVKILIEKAIDAREIECAILNDLVSIPGEIKSATKFYSYDSKYKSSKSKIAIPAQIDADLLKEIQNVAKKAFRVVDAKGMARVDFFVDKTSNELYLNEINTIPGFTDISMYPKMLENMNISYSEILDKLIENAMK